MLDIDEKHWAIVKAILSQYNYIFYAFGSRAKKTAKKLSDLDLCYKENLPAKILSEIEEKFEESDLPFKVELVDWNECSPNFQKLIAKDMVAVIVR